MRCSPGTGVVLRPADPPVPFEALLEHWQRAELDPEACRRALEQLVADRRTPAELLAPGELARGGTPATEALLFDYFARERDWICVLQTGGLDGAPPRRAGVRMPASAVPAMARLVRAVGASPSARELRAAAAPELPARLVDLLCSGVEPALAQPGAQPGARPYGAWPRIDAPGIYRREHASLVIRSRTTTLLVDPQALHVAGSSNLGRYPADPAPLEPDAIVITHHHNDHWHLPSILHAAGARDAPVIVPVTPRANLLTGEDFASSLLRAGLPAVELPWHATAKIGDIEIDALPFYGEQPTRDAPGPAPGVRSWGNCYRFTTPELSAIILVDSGIDPLGSMIEVMRRSAAERGPADVVLSNCNEFPEILNPGLAHYAFALPFERVRAAFLDRRRGPVPSMTLGAEGVAEACEAAQARYFLPYAHMFGGLGADDDRAAIEAVRGALARRGAATEVVAWSTGDAARCERGALWIEPAEHGAASARPRAAAGGGPR